MGRQAPVSSSSCCGPGALREQTPLRGHSGAVASPPTHTAHVQRVAAPETLSPGRARRGVAAVQVHHGGHTPCRGMAAAGPLCQDPHPQARRNPFPPPRDSGREEAPVLCSRSAPRQLSFPLTHELRERPGFARCPLPHRPHPDLSPLGQACGLCCAPQASSEGENGASCQGHCGGRRSHRGLHVSVQRSGGSVDSAVRTTGPL